jgi:carbamoyl-phosphate synthase large subunit
MTDNDAGEKTKTVLVTAAGTATAVNVIKRLADMGNVRIVTTDSNPAHLIAAPSRWHTSHFQVPPASQRVPFIESLVRICEDESVNAIYPIHDAEILAVAESRAAFPDRVQFPKNTYETVLSCNDKWMCHNVCLSANLPMPRTILGSELRASEFAEGAELVRKPRSGVGSKGVRRVKDFSELDPEADLNDKMLYQTPCTGSEFTVDVLCMNDLFVAVARERLEIRSGVCTKARVFVDQWITELSRRIAVVFGLSGLFCFQLMGNSPAHDLQIIDINPRSGGGTALTAAAGFPIYEAYFSGELGLDGRQRYIVQCNERLKSKANAIVCRYYQEVVTQLQEQSGSENG